MNRFGAVFWLVLVVVAGFATFKAKYAIQDLQDELSKVRKQIVAEQSEIRILTAEWTFLNQPERLAELNKKFLNLAPVAQKQMQERITDIAIRTPPATNDMVAEVTPELTGGSGSTVPPAIAVASSKPTAVASATAPVAAGSPGPASPPAAPHATTVAASASVPHPTAAIARGPAPHVQLAKAGPASLNSLIAQIAEVH